MKRSGPVKIGHWWPTLLAALLVAGSVFLTTAVDTRATAASQQATYKSPQEAIDALVAAVKSGGIDGIVAVLGDKGRKLASSGDAVSDAAARERFEAAYAERHDLVTEGDARVVLLIGKDEFPFPIPIVGDAGSWHFDTDAGAVEILDRRIGENELAAIEVLRAYVDAQREYAEADRDGNGVQYAHKLLSSEGKKDGLFWPTADGEPESPFGPLIAEARAEGYRRKADGPTPYHGYLFKVLTAQGKDAPGGARDYVIGGRMIGGFGLVAAPAEYANSGVMTFIVDHNGVVFQRDLGAETARKAAAMEVFDPDGTWTKVPGG
ncbi:DUF2950 family protein [Hyphomicrobium sp. xq]|uniref:DUF2950 family protein n=1 Tax=Hyphomicrobium album TaxID=2665159 RepID=A0A6I3KJ27_9HYPH|nr:DUF2950 domain-containing protein [Hyphomicrobium album]MTD93737.1 DUF2950 family protein [Hyphomicrobium album]